MSSGSQPRSRILFVDDEVCVIHGLRRMLRSYRDRWDMTFVTSPEEAPRNTNLRREIVERKKAEDELQQVAEELRRANEELEHSHQELRMTQTQLCRAETLESVGRLTAGIAHEINTPIQYVGDNVRFVEEAFGELGWLLQKYQELLSAAKNGGPEPDLTADVEAAAQAVDVEYLLEEVPKAVEQSLDGVQRVETIVRAVTEFSHPGTDQQRPTDLNRAITTTIAVSRNEWKYVAELVTEFDPDLPPVPCLPGEFNQVMLNLIVNAAHAIAAALGDSPEDKGTITVRTRREGDWAEIRIRDTGSGIPAAIRTRIFDRFFTTKEVGRGTGQGLAIARSVVVDKHGGTLTFETEEGKGTTFIIRLPLDGGASTASASLANSF